ncbi:MAG: ABC transporter permease subunit [Planctomycetota bacterium]
MLTFLGILVVLLLGYLLTTRAIPWLAVRVGRLLGFRMVMNPLTLKRVQRFKRIKRGYYSFMILAVLFVTSFFLEGLANHKPLYMKYDGKTAYPAMRDLGRTYFGWLFTISDFDRTGDFGIPGETQLDYGFFTACIDDPEAGFAELMAAKRKELESLKAEFADLRLEVAELREDGEEPEDWLLEDLASADEVEGKLVAAIAELEGSKEVFASGRASVIWPLYRFSPHQSRLNLPGSAPFPPTIWRFEDALKKALKQAVKDGDDATLVAVLGDEREPLQAAFASADENTIEEALGAALAAADRATLQREFGLTQLTAPLGTGPAGVDILPQLMYGFRVSVAFALAVLVAGYVVGVFVGGLMGFYGGWTDIGIQRIIEIWGSIPFLFTIMIIAEIVHPGFWMLVILLIVLRSWLAITELIRGEFYREKSRDYVQAAIGTGMGDIKVMMKHILPNSLVPVVSRAPFSFVNYISALVSLDYLGFGLPPGTPSWGAMLRAGAPQITTEPHLVLLPVSIFALTLLMVVMIGEAVREAFDPKVLSRLR